ncbi:hypothetical protein Bcen2424_1730 [Burkholderia cenocepacia HI2424]|nr:hypothetical protein Bcen2424_1730 [Burkholderia cenocepacia HI2424]
MIARARRIDGRPRGRRRRATGIRASSGAADCRSTLLAGAARPRSTGPAQAPTRQDRGGRRLAYVSNNKGPSAHEAARIVRREARQ